MTAIPARVAGVPDVIAVCPKPDPTVHVCGARGWRVAPLSTGRRPRDRGAGVRHGDGAAGRPDRRARQRLCRRRQVAGVARTARSTSSPARARSRSLSIVGQAGVDRRGPPRAGRARSRCARDPDHAEPAAWPRPSRARCERQLPADGPARQALAAHGGIIVTRTLDEAIALMQRLAPEHAVCDSDAVAARLTRAGTVFVGDYSAQALRRLRHRLQPRAADRRRRGGTRRTQHRRLRARVHGSAVTAAGLRRIAPAGIALAVAEGLRGHADSLRIRTASHAAESRTTAMTYEYEKVLTPLERPAAAPEREHRGLLAEGDRRTARAHAHDIGFYPDYDAVVAACAAQARRRRRATGPDQWPRRGDPGDHDRSAPGARRSHTRSDRRRARL